MTGPRSATPIEHGTLNGARKHRYRRVPLCNPCRAEERKYQRERAAIRRKSRAEERAEQGLPTYLTEDQWQARVAARKAAAR